MSIKRSVSSSSCKIFAFFPRYVLTSFWVSESLGESEVDEVNVGRFLVTNKEIVWLDVSMKVIARLNVFNSL
jgi:hypothetical protein